MTQPHSMTLAELERKFIFLQHFQKYYLRDVNDTSVCKLMFDQSVRTIAEIKEAIVRYPRLKSYAKQFVEDYKVHFILAECKNG